MDATATFETEHAKRHLTTLCKHFSQRMPTEHKGLRATVHFPFGRCKLSAHESCLTFMASASDTTELDQVVDVMTRHLERFAFRENPCLEWHVSTAASQDNRTLGKDSP